MNRWRGQLRRLRATANSCINQQTACSQAAHEENLQFINYVGRSFITPSQNAVTLVE